MILLTPYQQVIGIGLFLPVEATYEMHEMSMLLHLLPFMTEECRLGHLGTRSLKVNPLSSTLFEDGKWSWLHI